MSLEDSFKPGVTQTGPKGQLAHPTTLEHSKRLEKKLYKVGNNAWSLICNGHWKILAIILAITKIMAIILAKVEF